MAAPKITGYDYIIHVWCMISLEKIAEMKTFLFSPRKVRTIFANCLTTYKTFSLTLKPILTKSDTEHRRSEVD